jgi:hypothetical protein
VIPSPVTAIASRRTSSGKLAVTRRTRLMTSILIPVNTAVNTGADPHEPGFRVGARAAPPAGAPSPRAGPLRRSGASRRPPGRRAASPPAWRRLDEDRDDVAAAARSPCRLTLEVHMHPDSPGRCRVPAREAMLAGARLAGGRRWGGSHGPHAPRMHPFRDRGGHSGRAGAPCPALPDGIQSGATSVRGA